MLTATGHTYQIDLGVSIAGALALASVLMKGRK